MASTPAPTAHRPGPDAPADVLAGLRDARVRADRAEADKLALAVAWAGMHSADSVERALCHDLPGADRAVPIAGEGAPLVAELAVLELAAALGLSTDAGARLLGEAVELAHRLPRTWRRVQAGDLPAWKARRVAQATFALPAAGARFVDTHVAPVVHTIGIAALDRLVEEALTRFDPDTALARRQAAADGRHFDVRTHQVSFDGTVVVDAVLDLADALDLDQALTRGATRLAALGCTDPLDVRRSIAAGDLARHQLTLDLDPHRENLQQGPGSRRTRPRQVVLHVHLSHAALDSSRPPDQPGVLHLARIEETRSFHCLDQVRGWCTNPDTQVVIRPVLDLAGHHHVDAYEIPDRLHDQARLTNPTCVFPWCTRRSRTCDTDHTTPHHAGGPTCSGNLAPLCRRHHRAKTHTAWTYTPLDQTTYLWTSPHRLRFLVDHHGTRPLPDG